MDPFQITENEYPFQIIEEQIKLAGQIKKLAREVDLLIALTHFDVREDIEIAKRFPDIDLILGGDNHEKMEREVTAGERLAAIYKSDSNSRSVYIIDVCYDTAADTFTLEARPEDITDKIPEDPKTKAVVDYWERVVSEYYRGRFLSTILRTNGFGNVRIPFYFSGEYLLERQLRRMKVRMGRHLGS